MTNRKNVVGGECHLILEKAIAKRSPLTITTHQYDRWQVYKSNFIALENNRLLLAPPVLDTHKGHMKPSQRQETCVLEMLWPRPIRWRFPVGKQVINPRNDDESCMSAL